LGLGRGNKLEAIEKYIIATKNIFSNVKELSLEGLDGNVVTAGIIFGKLTKNMPQLMHLLTPSSTSHLYTGPTPTQYSMEITGRPFADGLNDVRLRMRLLTISTSSMMNDLQDFKRGILDKVIGGNAEEGEEVEGEKRRTGISVQVTTMGFPSISVKDMYANYKIAEGRKGATGGWEVTLLQEGTKINLTYSQIMKNWTCNWAGRQIQLFLQGGTVNLTVPAGTNISVLYLLLYTVMTTKS